MSPIACQHLRPSAGSVEEGWVTPDQAHSVALGWFYSHPDIFPAKGDGFDGYTPEAEMIEIAELRRDKATIAYVLPLQPQGFIIVTPHLDLIPVVAYSAQSTFDATETPENILLDMLRMDIPGRLTALEQGELPSEARNLAQEQWALYLAMVIGPGQVSAPIQPQALVIDYGPFLDLRMGARKSRRPSRIQLLHARRNR